MTGHAWPRRLVALVAATAVALLALGAGAPARAAGPTMAFVGPGALRPFQTDVRAPAEVQVARFRLDRMPVTNAEFLTFVASHPAWARGAVSRLFAEGSYLSHWEHPGAIGAAQSPDAPVVFVSWFAAKAYCEARGARLPTEDEWELAASAGDASPAPMDEAARQRILAWYGKPTPDRLPAVGQGRPNFWGIYDLHGLAWEWVLDFNRQIVGDGRAGGADRRVCGASATGASDKTDYASFMRFAFRSSLRAPYATANLGFRCAADAPPEQ